MNDGRFDTFMETFVAKLKSNPQDVLAAALAAREAVAAYDREHAWDHYGNDL